MISLYLLPLLLHNVLSLEYPVLTEDEAKDYPNLVEMLRKANTDPEALAKELSESPLAAIAQPVTPRDFNPNGNGIPIVVAHGMGDSCFNEGMKSITVAAGNHTGSYSVCIPTGDTQAKDTINGFLKNMDASVDVFAAKIKADPQLRNGFNAFGLSQGNNLIRGYITKYNDPPVISFISICGINAGVGAFPQCSPGYPGKLGGICQTVAEVLGKLAYNPLSQKVLFQADYYRDPLKVKPGNANSTSYFRWSQLSHWNNEGPTPNMTHNRNWNNTSKFVWVKADLDTMVWPRESEWWGAPSMTAGQEYSTIDKMKDTRWYKEDLFGLRTADAAGKNHFESFVGEHIHFKENQLFGWIDKYF